MNSFPYLIVTICLGYPATSQTPMSECKMGRITMFTYNSNGACGYGAYGMEMLNSTIIGAAPNEALYNLGGNASRCGECYEISGPAGSGVVMVVDKCPWDSGGVDGPCNGEMDHFDVTSSTGAQDAFWNFADPQVGNSLVHYRKVSCPVVGNLGLHVKSDSDEYWYALLVFNHRLGISSVEVRYSGEEQWYTLVRQTHNYFKWDRLAQNHEDPVPLPMTVRISSNTEPIQTITMQLASLLGDTFHYAASQFQDIPDGYDGGSSSETCLAMGALPVIYIDEKLEAGWKEGNWGNISVVLDSTPPFSGTSCIGVQLSAWGAFTARRNDPIPIDNGVTHLRFAVRVESGTYDSLDVSLVDTNDKVTVTAIGVEWKTVSIALSAMGSHTTVDRVLFRNGQGAESPVFYLDMIMFVNEAALCDLPMQCAVHGTCVIQSLLFPFCNCSSCYYGSFCEWKEDSSCTVSSFQVVSSDSTSSADSSVASSTSASMPSSSSDVAWGSFSVQDVSASSSSSADSAVAPSTSASTPSPSSDVAWSSFSGNFISATCSTMPLSASLVYFCCLLSAMLGMRGE